VHSLAPASGSRFSLLPPENATGNFTKIVQRVPVRIALDPSPLDGKLRPGLSVIVDIDRRAAGDGDRADLLVVPSVKADAANMAPTKN
jgi:membrane fusion protein (multidrug efflux system)